MAVRIIQTAAPAVDHPRSFTIIMRTKTYPALMCLVLLLAGWSGPTTAHDSIDIVMHGFRLRGVDAAGQQSFYLQGERATSEGQIVHIHGLRLELPDGETSMLVEAPRAQFNRGTGQGRGENSITFTRSTMQITGDAFEVQSAERLVIIRGNVNIQIAAEMIDP